MDNNKLTFALGLAQKAGKVASGDFALRAALKAGKGKLMIIAVDTSENSKKDLLYLAEYAEVPVVEALSGYELGHAIGKGKRSAALIIDKNFVDMIDKNINK